MNWNKKLSISVGARPWYEWVLWVLWFLVVVFLLQNARASGSELQSTATTIFWAVLVVWLIAGGVVWFVRRPHGDAGVESSE